MRCKFCKFLLHLLCTRYKEVPACFTPTNKSGPNACCSIRVADPGEKRGDFFLGFLLPTTAEVSSGSSAVAILKAEERGQDRSWVYSALFSALFF